MTKRERKEVPEEVWVIVNAYIDKECTRLGVTYESLKGKKASQLPTRVKIARRNIIRRMMLEGVGLRRIAEIFGISAVAASNIANGGTKGPSISPDGVITLFGKEIPNEAMDILFDHEKTINLLRERLREIKEAKEKAPEA